MGRPGHANEARWGRPSILERSGPPMRGEQHDRRPRLARAHLRGAAAVAIAFLLAGGAEAMTIPSDPVLSSSDVIRLDRGPGEFGYEFEFTDISVDPGWTNSAGDTVSLSAEIRFGSKIVDWQFETMMVFTSIRLGTVPVSCANLAPGGGIPVASFSVLPSSFGGAVDRVTSATDSQIAGVSQVCNSEDAVAPFVSAVFDGSQDVYAFTFQIEQTKDGVDLGEFQQLRFMAQAYVAPEPGTGVLVMLGLVGLGAAKRRRGARS